ncbi:hypothetical protein QBK99_08130 [Corticibacterium sp. UT-5YL-CI-8]|nr:hypothetical protein [Tianweitania sp. UT-5YL-CI-8]
MNDAYLSIEDFTRKIGVSRGAFYLMKSRDEAPRSIKIGRRVLIPAAAFLEWEKQRLEGGRCDA